MNLNEREKLLVLVFPAFLVLGGYIWIFGTSAQRELTSVRERLAEAESEAVTPQQVWQQQTRLKRLTREVEETQAEKDRLKTEADELCGEVTANRRDIGAIDALTALFERHQLKITDERPADSGDARGMATSLEEATDRLRKALEEKPTASSSKRRTKTYATAVARRGPSQTNADSSFRQLKFYGRFIDVLHAMDELAQAESDAIPVSITMEEIGLAGMYSELREWTLLVRI